MTNANEPSTDVDAARQDREPPCEQLLEGLLAEYDETLAGNSGPTLPAEMELPTDMLPELRGLQDCLMKLHSAARHGHLAHWASTPSGGQLVAESSAERPVDLVAGERIGRFCLVRELGRGGYGVVFLAHDPSLQREVALKVPRPEALVAPDLRRRFLREARAAARVQHPHLVPVHEIGDDGALVYLISPYCRGPSLARWLRGQERPVAVRDAARLVADLADGLDAAHHERVLHRDIKPGNVLLEPTAADRESGSSSDSLPLSSYVAKLNDFGLAKLEDAGEDETHSSVRLGTPAYMSPEQASGRSREIGPGTDIYALGTILYELLTRRPPFVGQSDTETLAQVTASEPVAPSQLRLGLPRDLEAICLTCLEKRPTDRYKSARALADDLRRFLAGLPTRVRPLTRVQKLVKWSRRNPGVATLSVAVGVLLAALALGSTTAAVVMARLAERERTAAETALAAKDKAELATREAEAERDQKEIERARALELERQAESEVASRRQIARFLIDLLEAPDLSGQSGFGLRRQTDQNAELTAREIVDRGARRLAHELQDQPLVRAQLLNTIGGVYTNVGDIDQASRILDQALTLQREHNAPPLELAETLHNLTRVRHVEGRYQEAERFGREALEIRRAAAGENDLLVAATMFDLAWTLAEMNRKGSDEADELFAEALALRRRHLPWNHRDIGLSLSALAAMKLQRKDNAGANALLAQAAIVFVQQPGGDKLGRALGCFQQATMLRSKRRYAQAEEKYGEAIRAFQEFFKGDHPATALVLGDLAGMLKDIKQWEKSEVAIREAIAMARRMSPGGHPQLVIALRELGQALSERGNHAEAIELMEEAVSMSRIVFDEESDETGDSLIRLAYCYLHQGDFQKALELTKSYVGIMERCCGSDSWRFKFARVNLAVMLQAAGNDAEGEAILRELLTSAVVQPAELARISLVLARLLNDRTPGSGEAEQLARNGLGFERRNSGSETDSQAEHACMLGQILIDQGRAAEAEPLLRDSLRICRKELQPTHWRIGEAESLLGDCLRAQSRFAEAEPLLVAAHAKLQVARGANHSTTLAAAKRLAKYYEQSGQSGEDPALETPLAQ